MQVRRAQEDAVHWRIDVTADGDIVLLTGRRPYLFAREVERMLFGKQREQPVAHLAVMAEAHALRIGLDLGEWYDLVGLWSVCPVPGRHIAIAVAGKAILPVHLLAAR